MVEVILLERIERLGQMGDIVKVRPGFARNFLLPQKKALRATDANRKAFESRRATLVAENLKRREEAEAAAGKMTDVRVALVRQAGESGQLYGSVTARDIADALDGVDVKVNRAQVVIERAIKSIGLHTVRVVLHPEVSVTVTVGVAQTADEAKAQLDAHKPKPAAAEAAEVEPTEEAAV